MSRKEPNPPAPPREKRPLPPPAPPPVDGGQICGAVLLNRSRYDLVEKWFARTITQEEREELDGVQKELLKCRPMPMVDPYGEPK